MKKPRIVIPVTEQNVQNYARALEAAGMEPVMVKERPGELYDGLLLPGGGDINPLRYGQENQGSMLIMDDLDELQFSVLDDYVKNKKPVLGICRGHQVINVYFGGTMIQHLSTADRHSKKGDEPDRIHFCEAGEDSWLARIYGQQFVHNSSHHQAVDRLGEGLVLDSRCLEDGTVEALHHTELPVYGVQWHPERMCLEWEREDTVNGLPVLEFFCGLCK